MATAASCVEEFLLENLWKTAVLNIQPEFKLTDNHLLEWPSQIPIENYNQDLKIVPFAKNGHKR